MVQDNLFIYVFKRILDWKKERKDFRGANWIWFVSANWKNDRCFAWLSKMNYSRETNNRTLFRSTAGHRRPRRTCNSELGRSNQYFFSFANPLLKNDLRLIVWFGVEVSFGSVSSPLPRYREGKVRRYRLGILRRLPHRESVQVTRSQQITGLGNIGAE